MNKLYRIDVIDTFGCGMVAELLMIARKAEPQELSERIEALLQMWKEE